jgi:hypothetical protein
MEIIRMNKGKDHVGKASTSVAPPSMKIHVDDGPESASTSFE